VVKPLGKNEKVVDPLFLDFERRNLRLQPGSPAVDTAAQVELYLNFDRNKIPFGKAPDIGPMNTRVI